MAKNTGWLRFLEYSNNNTYSNLDALVYTFSGEAFTNVGPPNNLVIKGLQNSSVGNDLGSLYSVIPEGSTIEGIEIQYKAKADDISANDRAFIFQISLKVTKGTPLTFATIGSNLSNNLTEDFATYTIGGPTNLLGCEGLSLPLILDTFELLITVLNPEPHTTLRMQGDFESLAVRFWYDPPPPRTRSTDWIKFTNVVSDSSNFLSGDTDDLLLGNTGSLLWLGGSDPGDFNFILNTLDSNGYSSIPSDSIITGMQVRVPGYLSNSGSKFLGKLSLSNFAASTITDQFFTFGTGATSTATPNTTGSYNNLFGLSLTPSDLSNLHLGIKTGTETYTFGQFFGLEPNTGRYLDSNIEKIGPAVKIYYIPPFIKTNLSITSGKGSIDSGKLSLQ